MKTKTTVLSKRQREGIGRNAYRMSVKTKRKYTVIIMAVIMRTTKGKLGFNLNTNDGTFLFKAQGIFDALTANTGGFYTPPFANLALLATQIAAFQATINDMEMGVIGAEGAKTEAKKALKITLLGALNYVNNLAFLDQANAVEIITGANMLVINAGSINKQDFAVRQGDATGEVKLISLAARFNNKRVNASYDWQYSRDNGTTWVSLDSTVVAKTVAVGMTVDLKTLFRKRSTTVKGGTTAWCNAIAITPV